MEEKCNICPRKCNVDRKINKGYCGVSGNGIMAARAALHFWEEPCISGEKGSGTIFFSGCNLRCVYCQNYQIAEASIKKEITVEDLCRILFELKQKGANNINLVTPTHYAAQISESIKKAKAQGFDLPFVYNCSGYESVATLKMLDGLIDVYLTDFKYMDSTLAEKYSHASDYPDVAKAALAEMCRQCPKPLFNSKDIMQKGVIVRHLLLPDCVQNAKDVVEYVYGLYGDDVFISLMSQYTPLKNVHDYPELNRKITEDEYDELVDYALELGIENAFVQEGDCAEESFIPCFDYEGL